MAKQGMKRPEFDRKKNDVPPVPEISGKARHGHNLAAPLIAGENGKVWHGTPYAGNDLAVDNMGVKSSEASKKSSGSGIWVKKAIKSFT